MQDSQIPPELHHLVNHLPALPLWSAAVLPFARKLVLPLLNTKAVPGVHVSQSPAFGTFARVYRPAEPAPAALLWMHAGGLIVGEAKQDDLYCSRIARDLGVFVVSVVYRLAPEHPYPAAIDDCFDVWRWLVADAGGLGVDPERIVVGGQSAGGGLAACLAQRVHDEGGPALAGQLLQCPMLDDRTAAKKELDRLRHPVWDNRNNRFGWSAYLGQPAGHAVVGHRYAVASRREDLRGLAPAIIGVGSMDLFAEESREYARRVEAAGVPCVLQFVQGGIHGFHALKPKAPVSREFMAGQTRFLRERLRLAPRS